jgi:hypothetical protein
MEFRYLCLVNNYSPFNRGVMVGNKELSKFYAAVLRSPGMQDQVKISLKVSRRDSLLLSQLIDRGLVQEDAKSIIPAEAFDTLKAIGGELLSKADFSEEFTESLKDLATGKV